MIHYTYPSKRISYSHKSTSNVVNGFTDLWLNLFYTMDDEKYFSIIDIYFESWNLINGNIVGQGIQYILNILIPNIHNIL